MTRDNTIERFLKSAAEYLDCKTVTHENRDEARDFLVTEFLEAITSGPDAEVSTPPFEGHERWPVWRVVRLLLYASPTVAHNLCRELAEEEPDVSLYLAREYASWFLAYYEAAQAIAQKERDE